MAQTYTDTSVNQLIINKLTKQEYDNLPQVSDTELYLVEETVDSVVTQGSTNPVQSGAVYEAIQNIQFDGLKQVDCTTYQGEVGEIVQHIGTTSGDLVNGYVYKETNLHSLTYGGVTYTYDGETEDDITWKLYNLTQDNVNYVVPQNANFGGNFWSVVDFTDLEVVHIFEIDDIGGDAEGTMMDIEGHFLGTDVTLHFVAPFSEITNTSKALVYKNGNDYLYCDSSFKFFASSIDGNNNANVIPFDGTVNDVYVWERINVQPQFVLSDVGSNVDPVYVDNGAVVQGGKFHTLNTVGELVPSTGDDLNDYVNPGTYGTNGGNGGSTLAQSLLNCPVTCGFRMTVQTAGYNDEYICQLLIGKNSTLWMRHGWKSSGSTTYNTWSTWRQFADSSNFLATSGGTVSGTLILSKTQDASGTANNKPALIVGGTDTQKHLEIDANEIIAKADGTSGTTLWLQDGHGIIGMSGSDYSVANPDKFRTAIGCSYGTTSGTVSEGNHTHTLSLATDSGTSTITLAHSTKYKLTAGGKTLIFTTPGSGAPSVTSGSNSLGSSGYAWAKYGKVATLRLASGLSGTYTIPTDVPKPNTTLASVTNGAHIKITTTQLIITSGYSDGESITYICQ